VSVASTAGALPSGVFTVTRPEMSLLPMLTASPSTT
jgi:hypothetical protein